METGKPEVLSQINRAAIVKLLKQQGNLSRADLTRMLNMSFPSVSSNVKQLLEEEYIIEIGESAGKNGLGRRSVLLGFNEKRGYVVGVCFNISTIIAASADLLGNPIEIVEKRMDLTKDGEHAYALIRDSVKEVLIKSHIPLEQLECISIGIPGIFDENSRKNRFVPYLASWEDIQIEDRLKKDFIDNVIIDNVVNFGVIGEHWMGNAQNYGNIMYVEYDVGMSAGLVINGELYQGARHLAGEIGYMVLEPSQMARSFSNEGALEELISGIVLKKAMQDTDCPGEEIFDIGVLIALSKEGNQKAMEVLDKVIDSFTAMLINSIVVINPEIVILSGTNGMHIGINYMERIRKNVEAHVPFLPEINISKFSGNKAGLYGALNMSAMHAISNIDNEII